jgi:chromosome segregation ATPase
MKNIHHHQNPALSPQPVLDTPTHPKKLDSDLKAYLMMMIEDIKKNFNSFKEIQENTTKEVEILKEKQENTTKQVMELNKTIQDLKREVETIKKAQSETTLEIETVGKKSGTIDASISNRIQEMEERSQLQKIPQRTWAQQSKKIKNCKKILSQNIQEIQDTMRRPNLRIIRVGKNEDFQLKGLANIFNKIIEENFPNLKKEMPMNIQEAYRTPNRLDQERNSS